MKHLIVAVLLSVAGWSQTAKVVAIDATDAQRMSSLVEQKTQIDKKIADLRKEIGKRYLLVEKNSGDCILGYKGDDGNSWGSVSFVTSGTIGYGYYTSCETEEEKRTRSAREKKETAQHDAWLKEHPALYSRWGGCSLDFEFSEDYRFIVPVPVTSTGSIYGPGPNWTITPANNSSTVLTTK